MPDDCWAELGIALTGDVAAIRRAYAVRLKSIDADRAPEAFMRLRQAYEEAVETAAADANSDDIPHAEPHTSFADVLRDVPAPVPPPVLVPHEERVPYGALDAFRAAFEALIEEGHTREAGATLEGALAQGLVPLGRSTEFVSVLAVCALADPTLAPDELDVLGRAFRAPDLRERAQGLRWLARIEADARAGPFGWMWSRWVRRRSRVARAVLIQKDQNVLSSDLTLLRAETGNASRYAQWLGGRIDAALLESKVANLERILRGQEFLAVVLFVIILALLAVAQWLKVGWWE